MREKVHGRNGRAPRILYVQYTNPAGYPPLQHSSQKLVHAGWEVLFLGTDSFGSSVLRLPVENDARVRQMSFCPAGWRQKFHYGLFSLWALAWALWWRPVWIYASDPLSTPIALLLSYIPGVRILYHEHDSPARNVTGGSHPVSEWARPQVARRARLCVLPNEGRAAAFAADTRAPRPPLTVWNCPSAAEVRPPKPPKTRPGLLVYYHGNLGPSYLPLSILKALVRFPPTVRLRVVGYETVGTQGYARQLAEEAGRLGVAKRLELLGPVPRFRLLELCADGDVGLAFIPMNTDDINNRYKTGASNKPFDYLACGLALLVSDLPEWREHYVVPGYGLACMPEDPESIAAAFAWYLNNPEKMRAMGEAGRQRILREWNYETGFAPVLERLRATD